METLKLEHLAGYLPYGLKGIINNDGVVRNLVGWNYTTLNLSPSKHKFTHCSYEDFSPLLYPLSCLTEEIEVNGSLITPVEYFEIGDDDNYCFEFDSGNIKLIKTLEEIAANNDYFDVNFLPHIVVEQLYKWHIDVKGLIKMGLAIDKRKVK